MERLQKMMRQLSKKHKENWVLKEKYVEVQLGKGMRSQRVYMYLSNGFYFFKSVVLGRASAKANKEKRNELVLMAWQRNADHELITFGFDTLDRLVCLIRHPAKYLDLEELVLYITILTRECDRFEYLQVETSTESLHN